MANFGSTMVPPTKNLSFLQIPKNASTRFRVLKEPHLGKGWVETQVSKLPKNIKHVVLIRDPADRYLSAVNMFLRTENNLFHLPIKFRGYLTEDQHFMTQSRFLECLEGATDIDYWYFGPDVVNEMIDHYNLGLDKKTHSNKTSEKAVLAVNPDFIKKHYQADYDLIDSVKFLNR